MALREIPIEVWWNVIDELANDQDALLACAIVCRGWGQRSRFYLRERVVFERPGQVARLAKLVWTGSWEAEACKTVEITNPNPRTLSLFLVMFAAKMPCLKTLVLRVTEWKSGQIHPDVFQYLSTFASITHLTLNTITFPSVQTFGRLVSALSGLTALQCWSVWFEKHVLREGAFLRRPHNLKTLDLYNLDLATTHDISDFLVGTELASTLQEITIRWQTKLNELDESGISALLSSAGTSIHCLHLPLTIDPLAAAQRASAIDFSKFVNLKQVYVEIWPPWDYEEDILHHIVPWLCDRLAELPKPSTTLRDFTLRLTLGTRRSSSRDNAVRHGSYVKHCKMLDDLLSTAPFKGLEQFVLEIETIRLNATDKTELQQSAPTRFPKLAARGVFRVVVIDNLTDWYWIGKDRDEDGSSPITELELP